MERFHVPEAARDVEALQPSRSEPGCAAAAAAEGHEPFHSRAGGGLAAAEQDGPHVRGRGRRGHAGGVLCCGAPLSPLLPATGKLETRILTASSIRRMMTLEATGLGGSAVAGHSSDQIENMVPVKDRIIKVTFNADVHASLQWNFRPQQTEIYVVPGETALAFYKAKNPTDKPVIGISTYNVVPFEAGQYFNKIQCFCFEEQRLNPQEEVDMPVFFYIDPEFAEDPKMVNVDLITLSYTFFEAKEGYKLPVPGYN
ncbi:cytochrome c oxidase assembly protein COX11, mitochondrial isoform X2 [Otolemur garnettii]|uniref:cytochrome c oxidase assembly protein COX11, mitochondrial isoform X2 n=1 Tax=Otolemur garnettii TaxID=30611 RepID=UPI000C7F7049|nr:cytochrome c oxidase assembly protein COX11, mitochondrial isoform X2 [Otolemur garnettii]